MVELIVPNGLTTYTGFFMTFKSQVKIEFSEYQYVGVENTEGQ